MIPRWSLKCSQCFGSISNRHNHCGVHFFYLNASINSSSVFFFHRVDHIESSSQCQRWWQQSFNWSKPRFFLCETTSCNHSALAYWGREIWAWNVGSQKTLQKVMKNWTDWKDIQLYSDRSLMRSVGSYIELALVFQSLRWGHVVKVFDFTFGPPSWSLANALNGYNLIPHPPVLHELPGKLFAPVLEHWHHRSNLQMLMLKARNKKSKRQWGCFFWCLFYVYIL